jgi:hypothetical protein
MPILSAHNSPVLNDRPAQPPFDFPAGQWCISGGGGSVDRPKLTLPNELLSPIGLTVRKSDRFTVEITRDRHFE